MNYDFTSGKVDNTIWDTLLAFSFDDSPKLVNALAESHKQVDDTTYEYTIKDAKFHNGDTITATDVKASFNRVRDPDVGSPISWALANLKDGDAGITVKDDTTVQFNLKHKSAVWQYMPAFIGIAPKKAMDDAGVDFGRKPGTTVGSGPYKVKSWNQGSSIELSSFDGFRDSSRPAIDAVTAKIVPEGSSRVTGLKTGSIDVAGKVPPQQWKQVENLENASMVEGTQWLEHHVFLNCQKDPIGQKKTRQALSYATNWDSIIQNVYFGHGTRQPGPLPKSMKWYNDNIEPYTYDKEKANSLLDEAGGIDRTLTIYASKGTSARVAVVIQSQWRSTLGIDVEVKKIPSSQSFSIQKKGEFDAFVLGWGPDYPDPDGILYALYNSNNWPPNNNVSYYKNEEVDAALEAARKTTDPAERKSKYMKAQELIQEDAPVIHGVNLKKGFGVNDNLNFPKISPMWYWQDFDSRISFK